MQEEVKAYFHEHHNNNLLGLFRPDAGHSMVFLKKGISRNVFSK